MAAIGSIANDMVQNSTTREGAESALRSLTASVLRKVADINYVDCEGVGRNTIIRRILDEKFGTETPAVTMAMTEVEMTQEISVKDIVVVDGGRREYVVAKITTDAALITWAHIVSRETSSLSKMPVNQLRVINKFLSNEARADRIAKAVQTVIALAAGFRNDPEATIVTGHIVSFQFYGDRDAQQFCEAMEAMRDFMGAAAIVKVEAPTDYDVTVILNREM